MRRSLARLTCLVVLLTLLVGCGDNETGESENQIADAVENDENITLRMTTWNFAGAVEFQELIRAYEDKNPHITIEAVDIASENYGERVITMLAGGEEVDILTMKDVTQYNNLAQRGQLLEITDFIQTLDIDAYQGAIDYLKMEDSYFAVPYRNDFWVIFYNQDIFDQHGIDYPEYLTWEDYRELAAKLTSGTGSDKVYGAYQHSWRSTLHAFAGAQTEGDLLTPDYSFMAPYYEVILGMQEDGSIMEYGTIRSSNTSYQSMFELEKAAMVPMGTWYMQQILTTAQETGTINMNWGLAPVPQMSNGNEEITTFGSPTSFAINANSKHAEEALRFIEFASGEEGAEVLAGIGIVPALRTEKINHALFSLEGIPNDELSLRAFEPDAIGIEMPQNEHTPAIDLILGEEHELIMIGENPPEEGIERMEERVTQAIN